MKVCEVLEHFLSRADWVDREKTVDRIIVGDPDLDVDRCLVTWMPSLAALRCMVERGVRLMICHEPTFWNHRDDRPMSDLPGGQEKLDYIREHGLAVVRNHDCWDVWPEVGIPWAWAAFLGLGKEPQARSAHGYQHRYDIEPVRLDALARRVAERCATIGEAMVQVTGELSRSVSKIGIGTGCGCNISEYMAMGCDCSIVCDDGSTYWSNIQHAEDTGHPVIRVNHGTSEEPGMVTLTEYVNDQVEGLSAELLPHGSSFKLVGA